MHILQILLVGTIPFIGLIAVACGAQAQITATPQVSSFNQKKMAPSADAPSEMSKNAGGYTDINVAQLSAMMQNQDSILVNVHIPFAGNIPQTAVSIPFNEIGKNLDKLPSDKNTPIVLYCRSGAMSTMAAEILAEQGYTNVMKLDGGMNAWQRAGNPISNN